LRNIKISEIFSKIEDNDNKVIMLLNAEYEEEEKESILKYALECNRDIRFVTMREFLFNKDDNVLKII
jgi:hypothetical protein